MELKLSVGLRERKKEIGLEYLPTSEGKASNQRETKVISVPYFVLISP